MVDRSRVNKELQNELIPKCKEILEIIKRYPEPFNSQMLSISIRADGDDYINMCMLDDADNDDDVIYLLDYCSYEEDE